MVATDGKDNIGTLQRGPNIVENSVYHCANTHGQKNIGRMACAKLSRRKSASSQPEDIVVITIQLLEGNNEQWKFKPRQRRFISKQ